MTQTPSTPDAALDLPWGDALWNYVLANATLLGTIAAEDARGETDGEMSDILRDDMDHVWDAMAYDEARDASYICAKIARIVTRETLTPDPRVNTKDKYVWAFLLLVDLQWLTADLPRMQARVVVHRELDRVITTGDLRVQGGKRDILKSGA